MNARDRAGERTPEQDGRRRFLIGAAAAAASAAVVAAGCSSGGSETSTVTFATTTPQADAPDFASSPFTLGVASGDPTASSVILWTRLAPDPTADDGAAGMATDEVEVVWEVAADEGFATAVASGIATAVADQGHSLHVDATDLEPGTDYWYRFRVGDWESPVGQTKTLPDGTPDRFGLAVVNCQMYESGTYAAYRHLLDEEVDLVAHLGDYIYEYPGGEGDGRHSLPNREVQSLGDFRLRYASYKLDPDLAAAHARFPFVATWDDHEVANNYMADTKQGDASAQEVRALRTAAYQAWWENMPTRLAPPVDGDLEIHQSLDVGDLARLYLLDQRQYADIVPCRGEPGAAGDYGNCEGLDAPRSRLGADQEAWLGSSLSDSPATWNLLGNPVVLAGVDGGTDTPAYYLDTWDGYPQARAELISQLATADNPVVLTGDYHAGMVLDVHAEPFDQASPVVAPEFMAPPISSSLFDADVSARTPQLRQQINAHGYLTVEVTPDQLTARIRTVDDVADEASGITTAATWQVEAGDPVAQQL